MKLTTICMVLLTVATMQCVAAEGERPHCGSKTAGQFWPAAANGDPSAMQFFVKSGELEVCSRTSEWRYRWQQVSISLDQLKKKSKTYGAEREVRESIGSKAAGS